LRQTSLDDGDALTVGGVGEVGAAPSAVARRLDRGVSAVRGGRAARRSEDDALDDALLGQARP